MGGCSIFKDLKLDAKVSAHANFKGMSLDGSSEKISPLRHTAEHWTADRKNMPIEEMLKKSNHICIRMFFSRDFTTIFFKYPLVSGFQIFWGYITFPHYNIDDDECSKANQLIRISKNFSFSEASDSSKNTRIF